MGGLREPLLLASNQRVGSSNLSGRATLFNLRFNFAGKIAATQISTRRVGWNSRNSSATNRVYVLDGWRNPRRAKKKKHQNTYGTNIARSLLVEDQLMRLGAVFERVVGWQPLSILNCCLYYRAESSLIGQPQRAAIRCRLSDLYRDC